MQRSSCVLLSCLLVLFGCAPIGAAPPPASDDGKGSVAQPAARFGMFGVRGRLGPLGRGTEYTVLESWLLEPHSDGADLHVRRDEDLVISSQEVLRLIHGTSTMKTRGDHVEYKLDAGRVRRVTVTIDGSQVTHENHGLGPEHSPNIPKEMDDPIILETSYITSFQSVFQRLIAKHGPATQGKSPLDGVEIRAIVPQSLTTSRFRFAAEGEETLHLPGGDVAVTRVRTTQLYEAGPTAPLTQGFDIVRTFWITATGGIVKMEIPEQRRHQGVEVAYDLHYFPAYAGDLAEDVKIPIAGGSEIAAVYGTNATRSRLEEGAREQRRPALLFAQDPAGVGKRIVHRTRWEMVPRGYRMLSVELPRAADRRRAIIAGAQKWLGTRPDVDPDRIFLVTTGAVSPDLIGDDAGKSGLRGWVLIDGSLAGDASAHGDAKVALPVLSIWGAGGDPQRAKERTTAAAALAKAFSPESATSAPLPGVDEDLRPTAPAAADAPPASGLAPAYVDALARWLDERSKG